MCEREIPILMTGEPKRRQNRKIKILLPLALKQWATQTACTLAYHVQEVFSHDRMSGLGREKHAEDELFHVDAAIRATFRKNQFVNITKLFPGAYVSSDIKDKQFRVFNPTFFDQKKSATSQPSLVTEVGSISGNVKEVVKHLEDDFIVVSKHPSEKAIEYVAPLWDTDGKMLILAVQVKHQPKGATFDSLDKLVKQKMTEFNGYTIISLVYTTHETHHKIIPKLSLCFDRDGLREYNVHYGHLKLGEKKTR